jgi:hypothetical protein
VRATGSPMAVGRCLAARGLWNVRSGGASRVGDGRQGRGVPSRVVSRGGRAAIALAGGGRANKGGET